MKVQSPKADVASQVTANKDGANNSQANVSSDFFSELIASMLSAPILRNGTDSDSMSDNMSSEQPQDAEQNNTASSFDMIMSGINPLLGQLNAFNTLVDNKLASQQLTDSMNEKTGMQDRVKLESNYAGMQKQVMKADQLSAQLTPSMQPANNPDDESQSNWSNYQKINVFQRDIDDTLLSDIADNVLQETGQDETQFLSRNTQETDLLKTGFNPRSQKSASFQVDSASLPQPKASADDAMNQYTTMNIHPALNPVQPPSTETMTVYTAQKGQVNYLDNQKNKYVDALVQLSEMVNSQTTQTLTDIEPSITRPDMPNVSYADIFNKVNQPDYDLKIDLQPAASIEALMKDTYNAHIKIYPPELGAVVAKLKLDKNNAELVIMTEHNRVKEVIQANLVQLRENFQNADINLTNIQVDVQTSQHGANEQNASNQQSGHTTSLQDDFVSQNKQSVNNKVSAKRLNSLVDTYA